MSLERVFITGIAGFIGSHVAQRFLKAGMAVTGVDSFDPFYPREQKEKNLKEIAKTGDFEFIELDIAQPDALQKVQGDFDAVIHLAAKAGVLPSIAQPAAYIQTNIVGTQQVLEWMKAKGMSKMLFASSSSVYGNNPTPFSEADDVSRPISPYAFTKKAGELMTHTYHHLYGMDVVNLRFFTVIGERQRPDLALHKFVKLINENKPVTMYGNGETARDYTYVGDIAEGVFQAFQYVLNHQRVYEIINLGNQNPISLKEMISTIYEVMGKTPNIIQMEKQPGDVEITFAHIDKARRLLQYNPNTSFLEGVERFVEWVGKDLEK